MDPYGPFKILTSFPLSLETLFICASPKQNNTSTFIAGGRSSGPEVHQQGHKMSVHLSINSLQRLCLSWTKTDKSHHGQGKEAVCSRCNDKVKLSSRVNSLKGSEAMIRPQNLLLSPKPQCLKQEGDFQGQARVQYRV